MTDKPSPTGTLAVILFVVGSVLFVLGVILALLWLQKRRRQRSREATMLAGNEFLPAGKSGKRGNYAQLEEEWSADMEDGRHSGVGERGGERGVGAYEQACYARYTISDEKANKRQVETRQTYR